MRRSGEIIFIVIALLVNTRSYSQKVWTEVSLNKSSVYVGEPVEFRISVFTSTWFTRGIDPGNIKVNGAFTVFFRPVSTSVRKEGKTYAGVELIYNVFPYSEKDLVIPSLEIIIETPPEGDFVGKKRIVRSPEKKIKVNPVPPGFSPDQWFVATNLSITDNWKGDLKNVKVGDVLLRQIRRTTEGTVSELIPPIQWDSVPGTSLYQARSLVENNKSRTAISATRSETMRYLIEREGELAIPAMIFTWFNPYQNKLYKRTLGEVILYVKPNPDLSVLASIRDSLKVDQAKVIPDPGEDKPITILGFTPEQFAVISVGAILAVIFIIVNVKRILRLIRTRRQQYRVSEAYYFHEFEKWSQNKKSIKAANALYRWIDQLKLAEPSLSYFAENYGSKSLQDEVSQIIVKNEKLTSSIFYEISEWKRARRNYLAQARKSTTSFQLDWINPTG